MLENQVYDIYMPTYIFTLIYTSMYIFEVILNLWNKRFYVKPNFSCCMNLVMLNARTSLLRAALHVFITGTKHIVSQGSISNAETAHCKENWVWGYSREIVVY